MPCQHQVCWLAIASIGNRGRIRQANNFVRQRPSVMSLSHLPILTNEPTEKRGTGCPVRPAKPTGFFFFFLHKPVTIQLQMMGDDSYFIDRSFSRWKSVAQEQGVNLGANQMLLLPVVLGRQLRNHVKARRRECHVIMHGCLLACLCFASSVHSLLSFVYKYSSQNAS